MSEPEAALASVAVRAFIAGAPVGHLATADTSGNPHNIPLCFCFDGARFHFIIDRKPKRRMGLALKRMRNIAENPRVALVIDHYEADWTRLAYVMVGGRARIVDDRAEYALALAALRDKYPQYRTMELNENDNPIVRIDPEQVHAWGARFSASEAG